MKKVFLFMVLFIVVILTSCTDSSEEDLPNETETQELQSTNPGDDGKIKDTDPDDDGEG